MLPAPNPSHDLSHLTPVKCDKCADGMAHLIRRGPDAFKRDGKTEIWLFECRTCGHQFSENVET